MLLSSTTGEMALLLEGLGVGGETSIEEYIIGPDNDLADNQDHALEKDRIKLYGAEEGQSWIAKPVTGQSTLGMVSRHGSVANRSMLMDPTVALFGSVHGTLPEMGSMRSMLISNFGSMFNINVAAEDHGKDEHWDEESQQREGEDVSDDAASDADSDGNLRSPLLSRQNTNNEKDDQLSGMGIGGGWQLAYRKDEKNSGGLKRIYLHQEGGAGSRRGSVLSLSGGDAHATDSEFVHAAALVSQSVLRIEDITSHHSVGAAADKQPKAAAKGSSWRDLFEPGVKQALVVGVGIQILQQVNTTFRYYIYICITFAFLKEDKN